MQFICPRSLPFWQECSGFLGGSMDLVGVADMCTAAHSDVANALAAGHCTVSDTPGRKCHGTCPQEGGHDHDDVVPEFGHDGVGVCSRHG